MSVLLRFSSTWFNRLELSHASQVAEGHRPDDVFAFCRFWATWEDVRDPLSSRCSISATKCGTISCRNSRPRPDVEKLASTDYLQSYFSSQSSFKISKLNRLTSNSFLALKKKVSLIDFGFSCQFSLNILPHKSRLGISAASILPCWQKLPLTPLFSSSECDGILVRWN